MRLLGVKFGNKVEVASVASISSPGKLTIGNNVWIGRNVSLYAESGIVIGNNVMLAKDVSCISGDHRFSVTSNAIKDQGMNIEEKPIIIGNDVWIGEKAIILKRVRIGDGSIIGAGSVVTKDVPGNSIIAGNPAKVIRKRRNIKDLVGSEITTGKNNPRGG